MPHFSACLLVSRCASRGVNRFFREAMRRQEQLSLNIQYLSQAEKGMKVNFSCIIPFSSDLLRNGLLYSE